MEQQQLDTNQLIQNLLNPQSQQQDGGVLQMLSSLLGPSSAEAASAPDPWTRQFKELQMQNQLQRQQQQQAMQAQQMQLRQQQANTQQSKQEAKSKPVNVVSELTRILGSDSSNPPDIDYRSVNPQTGTPYFSNYRAAPWDTPEAQQGMEQKYQQRQALIAAKEQQSQGSLSPNTIAKSSELSKLLKSQGYPAETINMVLQSAFPEIAAPKRKAAASDKELNYIRTHAKDFYNKQTGEPAGAANVLGEDLDPAEFRKQHMELNAEQKKNSEAIGSLDQQIQLYRGLKDDLGRTAKPGMLNSVYNYVSTKAGRFADDPTVASLDAARAQITQIARAFGGDSRVSDAEMKLLMGAVISDSDNNKSIDAKIKILEDLRVKKAKTTGLPWLQKQAAPADSATSTPGKAKMASQQDVAQAMQQAKGDRRAALELLRSQGFTGAQ